MPDQVPQHVWHKWSNNGNCPTKGEIGQRGGYETSTNALILFELPHDVETISTGKRRACGDGW